MKLSDLDLASARRLCAQDQLQLRTGPFVTRIGTSCRHLVDQLMLLYSEHEIILTPWVANYHVRMRRATSLRRYWRPQIRFFLDTDEPFEPYPLDQALPLFEWGLNWCIAIRAHQYLMLHAAVLERDGHALLMPAMPGSGKSTLCAALAHRGWRLLSDEFGLLHPQTGQVWPLPKPIPLKNRSIAVIREAIPEAIMGPVFPGTRKGDVSHVKPPADSALRQLEPATPAWVLFPRYQADSPTQFRSQSPEMGFVRLSRNSFNYRVMGEKGFRSTARLIRGCSIHQLTYSNLDEAIEVLAELPLPNRETAA